MLYDKRVLEQPDVWMDVGTRLVGGPAENSARWSVGICLVTASGLCRRCPCVGMADAADWWILVVQKDSKHLVLEQNKLYLLYIYGIYLVLYIYIYTILCAIACPKAIMAGRLDGRPERQRGKEVQPLPRVHAGPAFLWNPMPFAIIRACLHGPCSASVGHDFFAAFI